MTRRPPGLVTRSISCRAFLGSLTLRRPKEMVVASKVLSANGRLVASPAMKSMSGRRRLPTLSIPREKSHATTSMPASAYGSLDVPVPAARSRTRCPLETSMASTTTLRQRRVCPIDRTSLTTSYLGATSSNIVATSSGRLSKDARFTMTLSQMFRRVRTKADFAAPALTCGATAGKRLCPPPPAPEPPKAPDGRRRDRTSGLSAGSEPQGFRDLHAAGIRPVHPAGSRLER
ncbi:hypothetical protein QF047_000917 [Arthrobacter sp. W4I7]|nr:hypothetical protein [Arthrobacter sp. W4I7]